MSYATLEEGRQRPDALLGLHGRIAAPSVQDLQELTDLRCELEAVALRRSVALGGDSWAASVLACAHTIPGLPRISGGGATPLPGRRGGDAALHEALVSACDNGHMLGLLKQLREDGEAYRALVGDEDAPNGEADRQALADAAMDRDADRLIALTTARLRAEASRVAQALAFPSPPRPTPRVISGEA